MDPVQDQSLPADRTGFSIVRSSGRIHALIGDELDVYWISRLGSELAGAIEYGSGEELVVDLRETVFIDSSALRFLLELERRSKGDGFDYTILIGDGQVRKLLETTGVMSKLPVRALDGEHPFPSSA